MNRMLAISAAAQSVSYLGATQPDANDEVYTFLMSQTEGFPMLDGELSI